jgi:D-sedoheptulose 7-phosphate isomerase
MNSLGIPKYFEELQGTLAATPLETIARIAEELHRAQSAGKRVFLFGNGGSAATASHLANDFAKNTNSPNNCKLRAVALTDNVPLMTAWANDSSYEVIFAEQLDNLVEARDVVIGISTSGRSPNIIRAIKVAKSRGATTIALTGRDGGALRQLADVCVIVPSDHTAQIEDVHLAIGHCLAATLSAMVYA